MLKEAKRARRSSGEWASLIDAWRRSGLSQSVFSVREDISLGTFKWWVYRLDRANRLVAEHESVRASSVSGPTFVPVRVRGSANSHATNESAHSRVVREEPASSSVEVVLANGRRVRCDLAHVSDRRLAELLKLAEGAVGC